MAIDKSIFGLRFGSNPELNPTSAELRIFLDITARSGARGPHRRDLERYRGLIESLEDFERRRDEDAEMDVREKMFYGVLRGSRFVSPALELAVEHFKYHLYSLTMLDLRKPASFVRAAEAEIGKLPQNKKNSADAAKAERLRAMIEERKRSLAEMKARRAALIEELGRIARYIRDNLAKIARLCEASIVILAELQVSPKEKKLWIDDIKEKLKDRLRDSLHEGRLSRQDLDAARKDIAALAAEISADLREDLYAMSRLYESILGHAKEHAGKIDGLAAEAEKNVKRGLEDELPAFAKMEKALISLVADYHFDLAAAEPRRNSRYEQVLRDTRRDVLRHVLKLLEQERRTRYERRTGEDRRRTTRSSRLSVAERRTGGDRRSGKKRRAEAAEA